MAGMTFTYTGIRVRDMDASLRFYTKVMGMKLILRDRMRSTGGEYAHLKSPGSTQHLELNWYPEDSPYHSPYQEGAELDHLAFWARDVDASFQNLTTNGASVAVRPFSEDGYRLAFVKDPDGIWIELIGREKRKRTSMA